MTTQSKEYRAFLRAVQAAQRSYIKEEARRMDKAEKLLWKLKEDFHKLGLHVLTLDEVNDRRRQLAGMLADIPQTHGDGPTMRWSFENARRNTKQGGLAP